MLRAHVILTCQLVVFVETLVREYVMVCDVVDVAFDFALVVLVLESTLVLVMDNVVAVFVVELFAIQMANAMELVVDA